MSHDPDVLVHAQLTENSGVCTLLRHMIYSEATLGGRLCILQDRAAGPARERRRKAQVCLCMVLCPARLDSWTSHGKKRKARLCFVYAYCVSDSNDVCVCQSTSAQAGFSLVRRWTKQ